MKKLFFLPLLFALLFACNNDDDNNPDPDNHEEEITTVVVTFTDGNNATSSFRYKVEDGNVTEEETIMLSANTTYTAMLTFLNEEENPAEDVTVEVKEEGNEHLICYEVASAGVTIARTDTDAGGLPLGLETSWVTTGASTGIVKINLRHQPDLKENPVNCILGESDIEATYQITIE